MKEGGEEGREERMGEGERGREEGKREEGWECIEGRHAALATAYTDRAAQSFTVNVLHVMLHMMCRDAPQRCVEIL